MDSQLYEDFKRLWAVRRKAEATVAINAFGESFRNDIERREWARWFLANEAFADKIRHEIYHDIIFPVLLAGYYAQEAWVYRELARTIQNLYSAEQLWRQIDFKSEGTLLSEWLRLEPESTEAKEMSLKENLRRLSYCVHEWPAGILSGMDAATLQECEEILATIMATARWTTERETTKFLSDVEQKVRLYMQRLVERTDLNP